MSLIAVAAISARMLAEAARDDGFDVVALDLFGDADTRRACSQWLPIGRPGRLHIDDALALSALGSLAQRGVQGWIAGSGFEGRPDLLERGAALLPLIGTTPDAVRRVRNPRTFFDFLDAQGIAHPPVRMTAPADGAAWLVKDASACGGWHIRRAAPQPGELSREPESVLGQRYFQREMQGAPMSATFIGNGSDACVLGFNRLIVRRLGIWPFVFCGVVGPVPLPDGVAARLKAAVRAIAAAFSLRGLGSLDFMLDSDAFGVLELNPRPPASMALYGRRYFQSGSQGAPCGAVAAHVRACLTDELPPPAAHVANDRVQGNEIVFAPRSLSIDELAARRLAERADCHDLPSGAMHFARGDPICSVSAAGADAERVHALLDLGRKAVHQSLEINP
jgi:uncharacterized protein